MKKGNVLSVNILVCNICGHEVTTCAGKECGNYLGNNESVYCDYENGMEGFEHFCGDCGKYLKTFDIKNK